MSWYGVITDAGRNLIAQYIAGTAQIDVNLMTVGSGRVAEENMHSSTALVQPKDNGSIVSKRNVEQGIDFMLQIGPRTGGSYVATEIGIWANAEGEDGVLLMLMQNNDGVPIPAAGASVDFAYMLGVLLIIDNLEDITVTIDSTAYVPYAVFNPYCEEVAEELDGKVDKEEGKGLSTNDFSAAYKSKLDGIEAQANKYVLPKASASVLGGVKVGNGLSINNDGVLSNSAVRAVTTGTANGTISVNTDGIAADVAVKGLKSAAFQEASAFAQGSHTHNASAITEGVLPVVRGGTGISSNPSMKVALGSTNAADVFASAPRPGVDGTLGVGNGGTGVTSNPSMLVDLGSTNTDSVFKTSPRPGVTGTLPVARGGTGLGAAPKLQVNLASQSEASIFTSQPRPGVTGKLPIANGGTNATTAADARAQLGAAAANHTHAFNTLTGLADTIGTFVGNGANSQFISLGYTPSKVCILTFNKYASQNIWLAGCANAIQIKPGENYINKVWQSDGYATTRDMQQIDYYLNQGRGGAFCYTNGFKVGVCSERTDVSASYVYPLNENGAFCIYLAWR